MTPRGIFTRPSDWSRSMSAPATDIPYLTAAQMIEVDRIMVEDLHIDLIQMMENAGRSLAHLARRRFLEGNPIGRRTLALAGTGGNAGGVLVAARRLFTWGADVHVVLTASPEALKAVTAHQLDGLLSIGVPVLEAEMVDRIHGCHLVLDGILGYRLDGPPRGTAAALIEWANAEGAPILALDVPSGLDATKGVVSAPVIVAEATLTLALPKEGLRQAGAADYVGELYLADIGVPPTLYRRVGVSLPVGPMFAADDILRLGYSVRHPS
jgi:NAD(P)H-hydrate epimerase